MKDTEARYTTQEKFYLGVVYAAQKYKHYFQAHTVQIVSKSEGIKLMINNSFVTGRLSKWALLISEYDIQLVQPHKLGCQAVADMMALCSNQCQEEINEDLKGGMPEVNECHVEEEKWWTMKFDGTPSSPIGLKMALEMKVDYQNVQGASNLVIKQLKGEYGVKERSLAMYRDEALHLINLFKEVCLSHTPRTENKHADALATIGRKEVRRTTGSVITFNKIAGPSLSIVPREDESQDWRKPILSQFKQKMFSKATRDYHELRGELYRKSVDGLLMKCVTEAVGGKKLECLHQAVCRKEGPCLYRRM
ncbi:Ribonuclease H-like superfamily [Sesbania bispinosa]|nr:Ribonuclease H-like superfamily [Sesbania bispinosa]